MLDTLCCLWAGLAVAELFLDPFGLKREIRGRSVPFHYVKGE